MDIVLRRYSSINILVSGWIKDVFKFCTYALVSEQQKNSYMYRNGGMKQIIDALLDYGDIVNGHASILLLTVILLMIASFIKRVGGHV